MFFRDSDTVLLALSVSHTSETNEAVETSSFLFSSALMATEKMVGYSGTESSEKISPYL